jgi:endoglucanase
MPRSALCKWFLPCYLGYLGLSACTGTTSAARSIEEPDAGSDASAGAGGSAGGRDSGSGDARQDVQSPAARGLSVRGNKITTSDGKPFRGRGTNLSDTRSCNACTWQSPNADGLIAWSDELVERWNANFIRFLLESYPSAEGRAHWKSLMDDPQYYADIQKVVNHITSRPGVYVMVTLFMDPSMNPRGLGPRAEWPTEATLPVYRKLAEAFAGNPQVLFGLMNEPHDTRENNPQLAAIFNRAIEEIRKVEKARGVPPHIVVAQATQDWARDLSYWVDNPLTAGGGTNIAYEMHAYNPKEDFERLIVQPSQRLPMIIGEFGPFEESGIRMDESDILALMDLAEANDIPYIAWNFHQRCPPNMLEDVGGVDYDGCGFVGAGTTFRWQPTAWGRLVKSRLATPWR